MKTKIKEFRVLPIDVNGDIIDPIYYNTFDEVVDNCIIDCLRLHEDAATYVVEGITRTYAEDGTLLVEDTILIDEGDL